jgi:hypothetical protein
MDVEWIRNGDTLVALIFKHDERVRLDFTTTRRDMTPLIPGPSTPEPRPKPTPPPPPKAPA